MNFIREIAIRFSNRQVKVTIDPLLLGHLDTPDTTTTDRVVSFNLYRLIYNIGTIQTRRFAPSNRNKFMDYADLVEKIYSNTNEFRIKINEIRDKNGSEVLKDISEDFGVGISIVIAEKLFNIRPSTIQRIYGTKKRPDWRCQTIDNRILVVESKGSTSSSTSNRQTGNAIIQKGKVRGDVKVASLTLLNENTMSENRFLDPPIENSDKDPEMENNILRAGHYASVFSFLGNSKLSRYYSSMRKRLKGSISINEQNTKNQTFNELRLSDPIVDFNGNEFVGRFVKLSDGKYFFSGVDKELLSYEGFISFNEYTEELNISFEGNNYILFRDGVLIIEIDNINQFANIIAPSNVRVYQDKMTISDVDEMNELSLKKYIIYMLQKDDFENIREDDSQRDFKADITASKNDEEYWFELKLFKSKKIGQDKIESIASNYSRLNEQIKYILITNSEVVSNDELDIPFVIVDRVKLKELFQTRRRISDFL